MLKHKRTFLNDILIKYKCNEEEAIELYNYLAFLRFKDLCLGVRKVNKAEDPKFTAGGYV